MVTGFSARPPDSPFEPHRPLPPLYNMVSNDKDLQAEQVRRTEEISGLIRKAIRGSLPGPDNQFLTLMIPGKVVDFEVSMLKKTTTRISGH